ncbi:hypothetical protein Emag_005616 [Eimeria magna]
MLHSGGGAPPDLAVGGAPSDRPERRGPPMEQAPGGPYGIDRDNGGPLPFGVHPMGLPMHADDNIDTRFFIIRSSTDFNVEVSMQRGIWATIPRNETRLAQAVQVKAPVLQAFLLGEVGGHSLLAMCDPSVILRLPLSVEKTRNLFNRFNNGESVNRAMDGQPVDPEAGRALVYLFEEAFMAAGGGGPSFDPIYGGGAMSGPTLHHGQFVQQAQGPAQMQMQGGAGRQRAWQSQALRVQDTTEIQLTRRQQQSQSGGNGERKKQAGKRQEKSNASMNGAADGSLPARAPSNPAMLVFPIVLTEMTYDAYISAYEESQALWQRVFKKHGFDVGDEEDRGGEANEGALSLQINESREDPVADGGFLSKAKEEKIEHSTTTQEEGLSATPPAEEGGKINEPMNSTRAETEEDSFVQIKVEEEE